MLCPSYCSLLPIMFGKPDSFCFNFYFQHLNLFALDELLKILSKDSNMGKIRGSYLALSNLAWIFGSTHPRHIFWVVFLLKIIYLTSFVVMLIAFVISYFYLRNTVEPKYDDVNTSKYIKEFLKNKNLFELMFLACSLQFFYSWMVIYTPIYLSIHLGIFLERNRYYFRYYAFTFRNHSSTTRKTCGQNRRKKKC